MAPRACRWCARTAGPRERRGLSCVELTVAGAAIRISGDRDEAGLSITRDLMAGLPGAELWLAQATGLYEEDRMAALLADLSPAP